VQSTTYRAQGAGHRAQSTECTVPDGDVMVPQVDVGLAAHEQPLEVILVGLEHAPRGRHHPIVVALLEEELRLQQVHLAAVGGHRDDLQGRRLQEKEGIARVSCTALHGTALHCTALCCSVILCCSAIL